MADEQAEQTGQTEQQTDDSSQQQSDGDDKSRQQTAEDMVSRAELEKVIGERQANKERARTAEAALAEANAKLEGGPDADDLQAFNEWKAAQDGDAKAKAIADGDVTAIEDGIRAPMQAQLDAKETRIGALEGQLTAILRDSAVLDAALKAGAHTPAQVVALLRPRVKMVEEAGKYVAQFTDIEGQPMYDGKGDRVADADAFVSLFLSLPENANLIKATATPGSGAKPGGVPPNPTGKPQTLDAWNALSPEQQSELGPQMTLEDWKKMGLSRTPSGEDMGF